MEIRHNYREKLFYEQTLTKLNEQCLFARVHGSPNEYYKNVLTLYDYLIWNVKKKIQKKIEVINTHMNLELKELNNIGFKTMSEIMDGRNKRNSVIFEATREMHILIVDALDDNNLLLKRQDVQVGFSSKDEL